MSTLVYLIVAGLVGYGLYYGYTRWRARKADKYADVHEDRPGKPR